MARAKKPVDESSDDEPARQKRILDERRLGGELHYLVAWEPLNGLQLDPTWLLATETDEELREAFRKPGRKVSIAHSRVSAAGSARNSASPAARRKPKTAAPTSRGSSTAVSKRATKRRRSASPVVEVPSDTSDDEEEPIRKRRRVIEDSPSQDQAAKPVPSPRDTSRQTPEAAVHWSHPTHDTTPPLEHLLQPHQPHSLDVTGEPPAPAFRKPPSATKPTSSTSDLLQRRSNESVIKDSQEDPDADIFEDPPLAFDYDPVAFRLAFDSNADEANGSIVEHSVYEDAASPTVEELPLRPVPAMTAAAFQPFLPEVPTSNGRHADPTSPIQVSSSPQEIRRPPARPARVLDPLTPPQSPPRAIPRATVAPATPSQGHVENEQMLFSPPPEPFNEPPPSRAPSATAEEQNEPRRTPAAGPSRIPRPLQPTGHLSPPPDGPRAAAVEAHTSEDVFRQALSEPDQCSNVMTSEEALALSSIERTSEGRQRISELIQSCLCISEKLKRQLQRFLLDPSVLKDASTDADIPVLRLASIVDTSDSAALYLLLQPASSLYALCVQPAPHAAEPDLTADPTDPPLEPSTNGMEGLTNVPPPADEATPGDDRMPAPMEVVVETVVAETLLVQEQVPPNEQDAASMPAPASPVPALVRSDNATVHPEIPPVQSDSINLDLAEQPLPAPATEPEPPAQTESADQNEAVPPSALEELQAAHAKQIAELRRQLASANRSKELAVEEADKLRHVYAISSKMVIDRSQEVTSLEKRLEAGLRQRSMVAKAREDTQKKQIDLYTRRLKWANQKLEAVKAPEIARRAARTPELEAEVQRLKKRVAELETQLDYTEALNGLLSDDSSANDADFDVDPDAKEYTADDGSETGGGPETISFMPGAPPDDPDPERFMCEWDSCEEVLEGRDSLRYHLLDHAGRL